MRHGESEYPRMRMGRHLFFSINLKDKKESMSTHIQVHAKAYKNIPAEFSGPPTVANASCD